MSMEVNNSTGSYRTTEVAAPVQHQDFSSAQISNEQIEGMAAQNYDGQNLSEDLSKGNPPSENTVKQAVSDINKKINNNTIAEYGFHEKTGRVTIKIVDKESEKVIKEYPAEETLDMIAKVWELAGMFLDKKL